MVHRAAAAINDEVRGARQTGGPSLQIRKSIDAAATAVELGPFDMPSGVQALEANKHYGGCRLCIGKFLYKFVRLNGLRSSPGIGRTLGAARRENEHCESEERERGENESAQNFAG